MKKKLILLVLMVFLTACQNTSVQKRELDKHVTLSFFYITTCQECKEFKKTAIPYLEDTFQDQITINQYDLDASETEEVYDYVVDSLVDFDESMYGYGPFISVDGYFALLGYTLGDEKYLADDIEKAVQNQELSDELSGMRFMYEK